MQKRARFAAPWMAALAFLLLVPAWASVPASAAEASGQMPSLAPVIKKVTPAVVNISTRGVIKRQVQGPFMNPLLQQFFGISPNQTMEQPFQSLGSGVIINASKGYVLTNYHVIHDANKITVTLHDGRSFTAKVVGSDKKTDLAVVQIKGKNLTAIQLGNSANLQVGDFVVAIGEPFGLKYTATFGIVSALGRTSDTVKDPYGALDNFIQTDAAINPGNSGGALINLKGQLVGINTAIATTGGGNIGIGFAIPVNTAKVVANQLIKYGKVNRGELGVYVQPLTPALAKSFKIKHHWKGAVITQVVPHSQAAKAGLKQGDVIVGVNGRQVNDAADLQSYIGNLRVGTPLTLQIYRNGKERTVHAKVGKKQKSSSMESTSPGKLGASFSNLKESSPLYGQIRGVEVTNVKRDSPAYEAGLQPGDVITAVNRHPVHNLAQFRQALETYKGQLLLTVHRGNGIFFTTIR